MKNMNRREGKKIAVMAAIIMGLMMFAFMPFASATVTSFTVTPSTGIAGAVDSYNALVTTDGVTTINITIPAGFIGVVPMSGGVELARIDFWNSSTKAYYGYATFTANDTNPTTKIDAYCELGGVTARTTQDVDYTPGATNTFVSHVGGDTSSVITKLPTEDDNGSINVTINCTAFYLDDVMFAIKQFVRNPTTAGDYVFSTDDGKTATVTITEPEGPATVFRDATWYADTNGNHIANLYFVYGLSTDTPLVWDVGSDNGVALFRDGWWFADTTGNQLPDIIFEYGIAGDVPIIGDITHSGISDYGIFRGGMWAFDTTGNHIPDLTFAYGLAGDVPIIGDMNRNGTSDYGIFRGGMWAIDTTGNHIPDLIFSYGIAGDVPLVCDINRDGTEDIGIFRDGMWAFDTTGNHLADLIFAYGLAGDVPLTGNIV